VSSRITPAQLRCLCGLALQLGQVISQAQARETPGDPAAERLGRDLVIPSEHSGAQDIAHLFFHAAAAPGRTVLQAPFYVIVEIAHNELGHWHLPSV
jgi:hypothetical protein